MKEILVRAISYLLGIAMISFSIGLLIKAGLGTGAWDALQVGLSLTVGFTVGTWVFIVGVILILINAWLMRSRPDYLAIITIVIMGSLIDFWLLIVLRDLVLQGMVLQSVAFLIGLIFLSLGISIYLQANFAPVPIDKLMIAIHQRTGLSLMMSKTLGELIALAFAWIFGGPIGIGTVLVTFLIGPFIHLFHPKIELIIKKI